MVIGCLRLSDVNVTVSDVLSTRVGRRRKFGVVSCTECTGQGNSAPGFIQIGSRSAEL